MNYKIGMVSVALSVALGGCSILLQEEKPVALAQSVPKEVPREIKQKDAPQVIYVSPDVIVSIVTRRNLQQFADRYVREKNIKDKDHCATVIPVGLYEVEGFRQSDYLTLADYEAACKAAIANAEKKTIPSKKVVAQKKEIITKKLPTKVQEVKPPAVKKKIKKPTKEIKKEMREEFIK